MGDFVLRYVLDVESDGYFIDRRGRRRAAVRLRLACGHDVVRHERPKLSEHIRARCYLCRRKTASVADWDANNLLGTG